MRTTQTQELMYMMGEKTGKYLFASKKFEKSDKKKALYLMGKADAFEEAHDMIEDYIRKHSRK